MSAPDSPSDLLDLKFLPAWANETPETDRYANFAGEEGGGDFRQRRGGGERREGPRRTERPGRKPERDRAPRPPRNGRDSERAAPQREEAPPADLAVAVRFLPNEKSLANVLAEIKAGHLTYSVFALARLFLGKPERYAVRLQSTREGSPLFQLGESGVIATNRALLENAAFETEREKYYRSEVTQSEPIKGNFTSVARCRLSGTLLGPTNHHNYQPQLRGLYERRFSRRMSFADYQRQIEIVNDPAVVESWKEEARNVTSYTTLNEETPVTFPNVAEMERHFRQAYLPGLIRESADVTIDGVTSRQLTERALGQWIEHAWAAEMRSPTGMMQELIAALRDAGMHIFRHRRGMLFVSPFRPREFKHSEAGVSPSIGAILETVRAEGGIARKQLFEQLHPVAAAPAEGEPATDDKKKLAIAADLRWLVREGYMIEFNDGTLDLPRAKTAISRPALEVKTPEVQEPSAAEPPLIDSAELSSAETSLPPIS
jgi:hypothetical protein